MSEDRDKEIRRGADESTEVLVRKRLKRPKMFRVIFHNDDYTTRDFVVMVLMQYFHKSHSESTTLMLQIHTQGKGIASVSPRYAESKKCRLRTSPEYEMPLRLSIEAEDDSRGGQFVVELTNELKIAIEVALDEARYRRQEFAGTEHLLLALLSDRVSAGTIRRCGGSIEAIKERVSDFLETSVPVVPDHINMEVSPSVGLQYAIQRSVFNAQSSERNVVAGPHVLVALFAIEDCHAAYFLEEAGVERLAIMQDISAHPYGEEDEDDYQSAVGPEDESQASEGGSVSPKKALKEFCTLSMRSRGGSHRSEYRSREKLSDAYTFLRRDAKQPRVRWRSGRGKNSHRGRSRQSHCREASAKRNCQLTDFLTRRR